VETVIPVSSAAPHHGYGLRSREGGLLEKPGGPRDSGEVRSPDPTAPIRPPPVIEASSDVERDETVIERSGRASSGRARAPVDYQTTGKLEPVHVVAPLQR